MEFTIPTTREEMHTTLKEIYKYYRLTNPAYEGVELTELTIPRLEYTMSTEEELMSNAKMQVTAKQLREIKEKKEEISGEIAERQAELEKYEKEVEQNRNNILSSYAKSIASIKKEGEQNGIVNSNLIVNKISAMEISKNAELALLDNTSSLKIASLYGKIASLNEKLLGVEDSFKQIYDTEVASKIAELRLAEQNMLREITKYNNNLYEKEVRHANSILNGQATLELKYLEIRQQGFTKEELVDSGYYQDVFSCIGGYYDTLEPVTAYQQFSSDSQMAIYLEDYYSQLLYRYKQLAQDAANA